MGRRSYAGAGVATFLTAPVITTDIIFLIDSSLGWPTGANGPMAVVIDRDEANEEKVLLSEVNAGTAVASIRGYDGTTAKNHSSFATFELCMTAIDSDEANLHVNSVSGVHGLAPTDRVVGESRAATLTNKNISGADNTLSAIPRSASPEIDADLDALQAELDQEQIDRAAADVTLQNNIDAEALTRGNADTTLQTNINTEVSNRTTADSNHVAAADPHAQYTTAAELAAAIAADNAAVFADTGWLTTTTGFTPAAGWNAFTYRHRKVTVNGVGRVTIIVTCTRSGAAIPNPTSGNITNVDILAAIPATLRPVGGNMGGFGPGNGVGRPITVYALTTGVIGLCGLGGTSDLANNEAITLVVDYFV